MDRFVVNDWEDLGDLIEELKTLALEEGTPVFFMNRRTGIDPDESLVVSVHDDGKFKEIVFEVE